MNSCEGFELFRMMDIYCGVNRLSFTLLLICAFDLVKVELTAIQSTAVKTFNRRCICV